MRYAIFGHREAFKSLHIELLSHLIIPFITNFMLLFLQGKKYGWSRSTCDNTFRRDMEGRCRQLFQNKKRFFPAIINAISGGAQIAAEIAKWPTITQRYPHCLHGAKLYYLAVKHFGDSYYSSRSPSWCSQSCARDKGNPYH